jgi:DNA (cytosine-5)-methyltransferase 1
VNERPTHIDLFTGVGGFAIAAGWAGFRTVAFCEIDPYCQALIKERFGAVMADANSSGQRRSDASHEVDRPALQGRRTSRNESGQGCPPRLYGDIRTIDGTRYRGADLLTGGFPCQPFSVAGKRTGAADDRFLWPEMLRVINEARPAWVLGENVAGIVQMELDRVLSDLENLGYSCWPLVIPACAVDARHRRDRVWIVGHAECSKRWAHNEPGGYCEQGHHSQRQAASRTVKPSEAVADGGKPGLAQRQEQPARKEQLATQRGGNPLRHSERAPSDILAERCGPRGATCEPSLWEPEPNVGRVAHGVSKRVDRLKGLGNAIVPQVAYEILRTIRALI